MGSTFMLRVVVGATLVIADFVAEPSNAAPATGPSTPGSIAKRNPSRIAAGFGALKAQQPSRTVAPAAGTATGFGAITLDRQVEARLSIEQTKYRAASAAICAIRMQDFEQCYARARCDNARPPAARYSVEQCQGIPPRPGRNRGAILTAVDYGPCDDACRENKARWAEEKRERDLALEDEGRVWDAQYESMVAECRGRKDEFAARNACLVAHRGSCNPQGITEAGCIAARETGQPSAVDVRAMIDPSAAPPMPKEDYPGQRGVERMVAEQAVQTKALSAAVPKPPRSAPGKATADLVA
ncbi:MAG: hypothetical protein H7267_02695, partial [Sandarakinorhabdus sp.]|nr:hypothetical protein [Sandarakinorhabdus sp.]